MRTREEILREELRANHSGYTTFLILEVLLDIRDLLTPKERTPGIDDGIYKTLASRGRSRARKAK